MGIQGLLPLLKSITVHTHVKHYAQQTLGVDAYVWLHRGAIACASDLALGKHTTKYVDYAMHRVKMLQHYGVTPYIVLDGDYLPSKARTEVERETRRSENTKLGKEQMARGNIKLAQEFFQKAVDITPEMALRFIKALQADKIDYVVAPYEADAQLAYLERVGLIDGIVTEDSDLLVFGCKKVLFKLNEFGECMEISRSRFGNNSGMSLAGWDDDMFRYMAILSGCDYLASIPGMGLKTAHRLVRKYKKLENIFRGLRIEVGLKMPMDYEENFRRANMTFLHQRVFCPLKLSMIMGIEPSFALDEETLRLIGAQLPDEVARSVADGTVDPISKVVISLPENMSGVPRRASLRHANTAPVGNMLLDKFLVPKDSNDGSVLSERDPNIPSTSLRPDSASRAEEMKRKLAPRPSVLEQAHAKKLKLFESSPSPPAKQVIGQSFSFQAEENKENSRVSPFFTPRRTPQRVSRLDQDLEAAIKASVIDEQKRQQFEGFENPVAFEVDRTTSTVAVMSGKDTGLVSNHFAPVASEKKPLPTLLRKNSTVADQDPIAATIGLPTPPNSQNLDSMVAGWRQKYSHVEALRTPLSPVTPVPKETVSRPPVFRTSSSISRMGGQALSRRASSPSLSGSTQRRAFLPLTSSLSQPPNTSPRPPL
ncbi:Putative uncharacterized protein [Taphrina deformans PYCC 5710]|uniref:Uncharacterized protein n=1 Tax=Taphrina deformans (strain PYCC 5710 / ATCC 11124 / CBS 356.35 / IMI 108563 / JCM 9778 / NBRC 8474) TaxID=1097556 RepID=R4XEP2_TAPDE|nr:Putative uncharacterized protein [Taphrina deformans PYCC 5710]|eukprot:CCG81837.1 Putative uncharacterized protein [Taphrina deformans PYCC 5710]